MAKSFNGTFGIVTSIHPNSIAVENLRTKRKTAITTLRTVVCITAAPEGRLDLERNLKDLSKVTKS